MKLRLDCDPAGIRTQDPYIKSVLLYQLSYGILFLSYSSKAAGLTLKLQSTEFCLI